MQQTSAGFGGLTKHTLKLAEPDAVKAAKVKVSMSVKKKKKASSKP